MIAGCRFDWYEVTFDDADERLVASQLAASLTGARLVEHKGRNGYAIAYAIVRGSDELARVFGRSVRLGEVHIEVTGQSCDEIVPLIRDRWPKHRVSRADVSTDFAANFDVLDAIAVDFAEDKGISYRLITDSAGGATRYLGARSSEATVRVYKKSEQLRSLDPSRAHLVPDGIVRVEMQMRPSKREGKKRAATMSPEDFWGFARWTKQFAEKLLFVEAERVPTHHRRPSEWARTLHTLHSQYAPGAQRRMAEVGREQTVRELLDAFGLLEEPTPPDRPF